MKKRLIAIGCYSIFWLGLFILARIFFLLFHYRLSFRNTLGDLLLTFIHGIKLDISTTGYFLLIPLLFAIPGLLIIGNWYRLLIRWYTYLLILLCAVITVSDANLYSYWGFRMDYTPMFYLRTPGEAMASVTTIQAVIFFATIILLTLLFIFLYRRLIDRLFDGMDRVKRILPSIAIMMILFGSLIIPIRGGFSIAPINAGSVYFSPNMFLNHAAINAIWNVGTSAFTQKPVKNPYLFGDEEDALMLVDSLTTRRGTPEKVLNNTRPNIMLIILESFSGYLIGAQGGDSLVTPNFNRYVKEGLFFTNFYASGTRTDKAIPAILNGYPALPAQSIIKEPKKSQTLPNIVRMMIDKGYHSNFWYGGEIDFANFNSYVIGSGFRRIITMNDFSPEYYNSKWGVHDHILFRALRDSMQNPKEPFIDVILTLSSHEPFDVPMEPLFPGNSNLAKYKNSVFYADSTLGAWLDWASQTEWWKNTLVILVADHCSRVSSDMPVSTGEVFRIPMLWTGGALSRRGGIIRKYGSQTDIPATLAGQLDIVQEWPFGKDLLSDEAASFAFYTFNEGFGYITDSSAVAWDHKLKKPVVMEGSNPGLALIDGKAFLQVLFSDYLRR